MKVAEIKIEVITLSCPHCGQALSNPRSGSTLWGSDDIGYTDVLCWECDHMVKIPVKARRMLGVEG